MPQLAGGYEPQTGILHLDGGVSIAVMSEVYGHEFAEALNGPQLEISSTLEWHKAWQKEIATTGILSAYSRRDQHEGFAEFGRLVLSGFPLRRIEAQFPQAVAVWRVYDLVL